MPGFAVLEHDWPARHWDLFLEDGGALRAWRLLAEPVMGRVVPALPLPAHRLMYLDYEGPVSGGRGHVVRCDGGTFEWLGDAPERVCVELRGAKLSGRATLERDEVGALAFRFG